MLLASVSLLTRTLPSGPPVNFWLLRSDGVVSTEEDQLVAAYISSLRSGDKSAVKQHLTALTARPIAVEFESRSEENAGTLIQLEEGVVGEELSSSGPRDFLLPGAQLARVVETNYGAGGLGATVWDACIGLSIWLSMNTAIVRGKAVLELGSGVGLGGISAAKAGAASVTLSDIAIVDGDDVTQSRSAAELGGTALMDTLARKVTIK